MIFKLFLIYDSTFISYFIKFPPNIHVNLPWNNSISYFLPYCDLLSNQKFIYNTWCYFARGNGNLFIIYIFYYINYIYFTILSLFSFLILFIFLFFLYFFFSFFLFRSLASFHLECRSDSLGIIFLWPAGLPPNKKYFEEIEAQTLKINSRSGSFFN